MRSTYFYHGLAPNNFRQIFILLYCDKLRIAHLSNESESADSYESSANDLRKGKQHFWDSYFLILFQSVKKWLRRSAWEREREHSEAFEREIRAIGVRSFDRADGRVFQSTTASTYILPLASKRRRAIDVCMVKVSFRKTHSLNSDCTISSCHLRSD